MPVETAIKDGMEFARTLHILHRGQHVIQLVGIFARDVPKRGARKVRREVPRQCDRHGHPQKRKTRQYISSVFPISISPAVGSCTLMTVLRSGSSSNAAGTILKSAAMGVVSVPQKPESMPIAPITAGLPWN